MAYWILKTEPSSYGYDDLERDGSTVWDGVRNALAQSHLRAMRAGDQVLIYHSGKAKAVIGRARLTSDAYPDPAGTDTRQVVVELAPAGRLPRPVTLAEIKAEPALRDLGLVRMGRLSVMPASAAQWKHLLALAQSG